MCMFQLIIIRGPKTKKLPSFIAIKVIAVEPHSCVCFQHVFSVVFSYSVKTNKHTDVDYKLAPKQSPPISAHSTCAVDYNIFVGIFLLFLSSSRFFFLSFLFLVSFQFLLSSFFFLSSSFFFFLLLPSSSVFLLFFFCFSSVFLLFFFCFSSVFLCGSRSTVFSFLPLDDVGFDSVDELQSTQ